MSKVTEEVGSAVQEILNGGIDVSIPRKQVVVLFGSVIVANVATIFVLQGIVIVTKRMLKKPENEEMEETQEIHAV